MNKLDKISTNLSQFKILKNTLRIFLILQKVASKGEGDCAAAPGIPGRLYRRGNCHFKISINRQVRKGHNRQTVGPGHAFKSKSLWRVLLRLFLFLKRTAGFFSKWDANNTNTLKKKLLIWVACHRKTLSHGMIAVEKERFKRTMIAQASRQSTSTLAKPTFAIPSPERSF